MNADGFVTYNRLAYYIFVITFLISFFFFTWVFVMQMQFLNMSGYTVSERS